MIKSFSSEIRFPLLFILVTFLHLGIFLSLRGLWLKTPTRGQPQERHIRVEVLSLPKPTSSSTLSSSAVSVSLPSLSPSKPISPSPPSFSSSSPSTPKLTSTPARLSSPTATPLSSRKIDSQKSISSTSTPPSPHPPPPPSPNPPKIRTAEEIRQDMEKQKIATTSSPKSLSSQSPSASLSSTGTTPSTRLGEPVRIPEWYLQRLHEHIYRLWYPPTRGEIGSGGYLAILELDISRSGVVLNKRVIQWSQNVAVNQTIELLCQHLTQVPPLPAEYGYDQLRIPIELRIQDPLTGP